MARPSAGGYPWRPTGPDAIGQILATRMWPTALAERVCHINDLDNSHADRLVPVNHALHQLRQKDAEIERLRAEVTEAQLSRAFLGATRSLGDQVRDLRERNQALTNLAEASADYFEAILEGHALPRSDSEIDTRFESEVLAYMVATGRRKPDPADDISQDPQASR